MNPKHVEIIARELGLREHFVARTIELLVDGATIPFISRYRKEATGSMDETQVMAVKDRHDDLLAIEKRRESIIASITEQDKMTPDLLKKLTESYNLTELEDLYLPYKPKRKTRASMAREKGLEPLADLLQAQRERDVEAIAAKYLNDAVTSIDDALQGARDIIAERVSEDARARNGIRAQFDRSSEITTKVVKDKEEEGAKYRDYFSFNEPLHRCPSHRLLAIMRAEKEGILRLSIDIPEEPALRALSRQFVAPQSGAASKQVEMAVEDSYKRLIKPSIETEYYNKAKERADEEAIRVFAENLRQLLLAPPLGPKRILAIDPGFRTGCKLVCIDEHGTLLHNETIYPHPPQNEDGKSMAALNRLVSVYKIDAIAIGNGTAGRETEQLVKRTRFERDVKAFVVNEAGASVYSASSVAREEFPQFDVTVRGSVSIGRRLMDPLAELVKIEPKSIGVGQYQHDVDQSKLGKSLGQVVENCVNLVGVDLNTASKHLLTYVSGLGPSLADNIIKYRGENGEFHSRNEILKVPRMGKKAFEQAAGFLRISGAKNPLDNSAVHPESYHIVEKMAKDLNASVGDLLAKEELRKQIDPKKYVTDTVGLPTLTDIMQELAKPGRDPRSAIKQFSFDESIRTIDDLSEGMILPGIVTNITNFGAFVDIGIKENGLVHISHIQDKYISNPADVLKLNQHVQVKVLEIDRQRKRIQLSMKGVQQ